MKYLLLIVLLIGCATPKLQRYTYEGAMPGADNYVLFSVDDATKIKWVKTVPKIWRIGDTVIYRGKKIVEVIPRKNPNYEKGYFKYPRQ